MLRLCCEDLFQAVVQCCSHPASYELGWCGKCRSACSECAEQVDVVKGLHGSSHNGFVAGGRSLCFACVWVTWLAGRCAGGRRFVGVLGVGSRLSTMYWTCLWWCWWWWSSCQGCPGVMWVRAVVAQWRCWRGCGCWLVAPFLGVQGRFVLASVQLGWQLGKHH